MNKSVRNRHNQDKSKAPTTVFGEEVCELEEKVTELSVGPAEGS